VRTLGIDLAAQARGTAACVVRWSDGVAKVERLDAGLTNDDLLPPMHDADVVGLDAPFGWPADFAEAVRRWSDAGEWLPAWDDKNGCPTLRLRETDRWVTAQIFKQPLSVSSDRIGITAWRAAALLARFHDEDGSRLDRVRGTVREVYPAAALIRWKLLALREPTSYKRDAAARDALLQRLAAAVPWLTIADEHRTRLHASDHAIDALVSALVARAAALDRATPPPPDPPPGRSEVEGWIWVPEQDSLAGLATA
jgi:Protein of unknown function (DUF429)